jgi:hypothetical protein
LLNDSHLTNKKKYLGVNDKAKRLILKGAKKIQGGKYV